MSETLSAEERIKQLEAELAATKRKGVYVKFGNKKNVVVGGIQRFPTTLYAEGWVTLANNMDMVKDFIRENHDQLEWKNGDPFAEGIDPFNG
jgi:hypothetical protein